MATITDLKKIETSTLQKILEACEKSFPKELSLEEFYGEGQTTWSIPEVGIIYKNTKSKDDLLNFIETLTDTKNIRLAYATIFEEVENRKSESKEAPRPEDQTRTTLSEEELKQLQTEQVSLETKRKETILKSEQEVREAIKRKQEIYTEEINKSQIDKLKNVVINPTENLQEIKINEEEKKIIFNLAQAVKTDPYTAQKIFEEKIQKSIDISPTEIQENISKPIVSRATTDLVEKLKSFEIYNSPVEIPDILYIQNPISPLTAVTDPENPKLKELIQNKELREKISESAQTLSVAIEAKDKINYSLTEPLFESTENISEIFYPEHITQYQLSSKQEKGKDGNSEIDLSDIYYKGRNVHDLWQKLANKTTSVTKVVSSTAITPYSPTTIVAASKATQLLTSVLPASVGAVIGFRIGVLTSYNLLSSRLLTGGVTSAFSNTLITSTSAPAPFMIQTFDLVNGVRVPSTSGMVLQTKAEIEAFGIASGTKAGTTIAGQTARQSLNVTLGNAVARGVSGIAAKLGFTAASAKIGATIGTGIIPVIGTVVGLVLGALFGKLIEKIDWKKLKDKFLPVVAIGGGLLIGGPVGLSLIVGGGLVALGILKSGLGIASFLAKIGGIIGGIAITIATPVIITLLIIPPVIAFIMLIINSGAYIVPPGGFGQIPFGGNITKCDPEFTGKEITHQLASSIRSGSVRFLPMTLGSRRQQVCMDPTMIILHTSAGIDNNQGNDATYGTLVQNNVSCQMATDTDDTILMLSFFEKQVEFSWCANNLNTGGISTEMAGECPDEHCRQYSICGTDVDLTYTPDGPHPCPPLEDLSFDAICKVMQQYKIPWTQIFQHEASNGSHTDPVGDEWVDKFILKLKDNCKI